MPAPKDWEKDFDDRFHFTVNRRDNYLGVYEGPEEFKRWIADNFVHNDIYELEIESYKKALKEK